MDDTSSSMSSKNCNFTCGFLSAAKSAASFQNPPQAMKMISKAMVEFVSTPWIQPCPSCRSILPETKTPKSTNQTLAMVVLHISQINAIDYYEKLANDVRVKNMQLFHYNNA